MKKTKLLSIFLCALCAFASVAMFACGGGVEKTPIEKLPEVVQTLDNNDELFKRGSVDGVVTNFRIEPLNENNLQYNRVFVIAINYIDKYKGDVAKLKDAKIDGRAQEAIGKLEENLTYMRNSYANLVTEQERLSLFDKGSKPYMGAFQLFKVVATEFVDYTYQVALSLGEIERYQFAKFDAEGNAATSAEAIKDYLSLKVGYDYFRVLIKNCNSLDYTSQLSYLMNFNTSALSRFVSTYVASTNYKTLTKEDVAKLVDLYDRLQVERDFVNVAFEKFSLYDYVQSYDADLEKYGKDLEFASEYYGRIETYYTMLSTYTANIEKLLLN